MSNEDLRRLIRNDDYSSLWEEGETSFTSDEIDEDAFKDYYESAVSCGRLEMKSYDKEKLFSTLELVKDGYLKNGGYALFGKNAKIGLKLAVYATDNKITFLDLKLINGNIYNLINKAERYILNNISWRMIIKSTRREEIPEIPKKSNKRNYC